LSIVERLQNQAGTTQAGAAGLSSVNCAHKLRKTCPNNDDVKNISSNFKDHYFWHQSDEALYGILTLEELRKSNPTGAAQMLPSLAAVRRPKWAKMPNANTP
jgi:hypothetical protein